MIIKKAGISFRFKNILGLFSRGNGRKIFFRTLALTSVAVTAVFFAALANRTYAVQKIIGIFSSGDYKRIPLNYLGSFLARPERLSIDIKDIDLKKLAYCRAIALERGFLLNDAREEVPAFIRYGNYMYKVDIRLKGNLPDHFGGDKWSFRIKVKGNDTIMGMRQFSIQHPGTKLGLNEWYYKKLLEYAGLMSQRYDFVDVTINGKRMGIYALEEHFDKRLVEHNNRREGPILFFDDSYFWEVWARTSTLQEHVKESYFASDIDEYSSKKISEDPVLSKMLEKARFLLESFRLGRLPASQVCDIKKTAKLFAISELCGSFHSHEYGNVKFYYNPITSLFEPIGSDVGDIIRIDHLAASGERTKREGFFGTWEELLFKDKVFFREYVKALEEVSGKEYLDAFFKKTNREMVEKLKILHKGYPWYSFKDKPTLYANQKFIRGTLDPYRPLKAYFTQAPSENNMLRLKLGNVQSMPIELICVLHKGSDILPLVEATMLPGKSKTTPVDYRHVDFIIPDGVKGSDLKTADLKVKYRIPGSLNVRYENIYPWPYSDEGAAVLYDLTRRTPNIYDFDFLSIDENAKKILFKNGEWNLKTDLIIPEGYEIIATGPLRLDLTDSSKIFSRSPMNFLGGEDAPIYIYSSDSTGQGIVVIGAEKRSIFRYVSFDGLSNPHTDGWLLTGALTFYESNVTISDCTFTNNKAGDDYLNIVRSDFEITNSAFSNVPFDAVDGDFTSGRIRNCRFVSVGNDAIDLCGSSTEIQSVYVNKAGDKGISVGEASTVTASSIVIENAKIGVATKDMSKAAIDGIRLVGCDTGLELYQKKPEFGPSSMSVTAAEIKDTSALYLVEEGCTLTLDGRPIGTNKKKANF